MQTENRCPECGKDFDPNDPELIRKPRRKPSLIATIAIYLLPYLLSNFLWMMTYVNIAKQQMPTSTIVDIGIIQAGGPFACLQNAKPSQLARLITLGLWMAWLFALIATPLRRAPIWAHFVLSFFWTFSACMRIGAWV